MTCQYKYSYMDNHVIINVNNHYLRDNRVNMNIYQHFTIIVE
jgi:hypothetical protein